MEYLKIVFYSLLISLFVPFIVDNLDIASDQFKSKRYFRSILTLSVSMVLSYSLVEVIKHLIPLI